MNQSAEKSIEFPVKMSGSVYREFIVFDIMRHQKRWIRPLLFAAIMLAFAGICMSQIGKREGAGLLCAVLSIIGLGLPIAYFGRFFRNLERQCKALDKAGRVIAYRLRLDEAGMDVWLPGEMEKANPSQHYGWQDMYIIYKTKTAIYIYVQKNKAYLLPLEQLGGKADSVWSLAQSSGKCKGV